jgi:hypothetical protein
MTPDDLLRRLETERIVPLLADEWESLAEYFEVAERYGTGVAGELLIVRTPTAFIAVEEPNRGERVVRLLGNEAEARRFVEQRLEQYERMWDGCGCKVDYYS